MPRAEETATSLMQLAETIEERTRIHRPGEDILKQAMAGQHWVAIGDIAQEEVMTNAGRKVADGVLFRVAVSVAGRRLVALIDSGASQSYISPDTAALCELKCSPVEIHLELADGSKIQATQKTLDVPCTVGESVCKMSFTVTKLLSNVDVVLGIDWLKRWNPVIDWKKQTMYIWVHGVWNHVHGILLNAEQHIGTVKEFSGYCENVHPVPDFTIMKQPQFWDFKTDQREWKSMNERTVQKQCINTVQSVEPSTSKQTRQLISSKQMVKLMHKGETVYLAMIRPSNTSAQGMTQKVKFQKMKETGPIRKAPPVAETRKKMCSEAPADVRMELDTLLREYADLFPERLPKGQPPKRKVEFEINTEEGAVPPSKPPYRLSPKEHDELQAQIDELLAQGHIRPSSSPYGAPVLFVPKKDGRWRMCIDYRALNK